MGTNRARRMFAAALLAIAAGAGCASDGSAIARASVMDTAGDVTRRYASAWNANDMHAFGALFAADARYVNLDGAFVRGRPAIVSVHGGNRARYPAAARMTANLEGARAITDDAIVSVMVVRFSSEAAGARAARVTLTLARREREWLIAQAQASPVE